MRMNGCLKTRFDVGNNFGRSAPVIGRSNVNRREALEKSGAMARCAMLWPRTTTFRARTFLTHSQQHRRTPVKRFSVVSR